MTDLRVCHLYPEHLNIYADRGNIAVLRYRCERRGIGFEAIGCGPGDALAATPTSTTWAAARTATRWRSPATSSGRPATCDPP